MFRKRFEWKIREKTLQLGERTLLVGVLNITPDSFSDGGKYLDPDRAFAHAIDLEEQGADIIDIGAESTRPGGFSADVDDVGALLFEVNSVRESAIRIQVLSAVGKGVWRDVQHTHQQRPLAELQGLFPNLPFKSLPKHAELRVASASYSARFIGSFVGFTALAWSSSAWRSTLRPGRA